MQKLITVILFFSVFTPNRDNRVKRKIKSCPIQTITKSNKDLVTKLWKEKNTIRNEWLTASQKIVEKIQDPEVTKIFRYIKKHQILGAATPQGIQTLEQIPNKDRIFIIPVEKHEIKYRKWGKIIFNEALGRYIPNCKSIILKNETVEDIYKALIFLHEAYHAYSFLKTENKHEDTDDFISEEIRAHNFQYKIMSLYFGKKYQQGVNEESNWLAKLLKEKKVDLLGKKTMRITNKYLLKELIFKGSKLKRKTLAVQISRHIIFLAIDKLYPSSKVAYSKKAFFMKEMFKHGGYIK